MPGAVAADEVTMRMKASGWHSKKKGDGIQSTGLDGTFGCLFQEKSEPPSVKACFSQFFYFHS